jgi:hypothetical protein
VRNGNWLESMIRLRGLVGRLLATAVVSIIWLCTGGCQSSSLEPDQQVVLQARLVERIKQIEQFSAAPIVHHALSGPIGKNAPNTMVLIVSGDADHNVYIFEQKRRALLERMFGEEAEYDVAFKAVINRPPTARVNWYMWPAEALLVDADGDGSKELFVRFDTMAADRGIHTFILFSRQNGSWRGYVSPYVVVPIREQLGDVGMYAEDFKEAAEFGGEKHYMQPLSNCGDCWYIAPRPDGSGKNFLAIVTLSEGEATAAPHRRAMIMYRFTDTGFELDLNWNSGKVFATKDPVDYRRFNEQRDELIRRGFAEAIVREGQK